jgi:hypothetical protein
MTDLSGRVQTLEDAYTYLMQQLLVRPDTSNISSQSTITNNQLGSLSSSNNRTETRLSSLENKSINLSMSLSNALTNSLAPSVTGLYVTGAKIQGNISLTGQNGIRVTSSGQDIYLSKDQERSFSLSLPALNDSFTIIHTDAVYTLKSVYSIVKGTATPGVSWNLFTGEDRSSDGYRLVSSGINTTSTINGNFLTGSYIIPSGYFLWMNVTGAIQGTVTELFSWITFSN